MRKSFFIGALLGLTIPSLGGAAEAADAPATFAEALKQGKLIADFRYRHEFVSDDAVDGRDANATTLRTVVGFESKAFRGLRFRVEAEDVSVVGANSYANGGAGAPIRGPVANGTADMP